MSTILDASRALLKIQLTAIIVQSLPSHRELCHVGDPTLSSRAGFSYTVLPAVRKTVFRMGVASSYGVDSADIRWAADQGSNYWVWGRGFRKVTDGIREVIRSDRQSHVVAVLGRGFFGWQARRSAENAQRKLGTDYLDVFKPGWLGRGSKMG